MNQNEEELQRNVESGIIRDNIDSKSYEYVFDALKQEPRLTLSEDFADRVIILARQKQSGSKDFFWLGFGVFLLFVAMVFAISQIQLTIGLGFLSEMKSYGGLLVFGCIFIAILHWIDRRYIHKTVA